MSLNRSVFGTRHVSFRSASPGLRSLYPCRYRTITNASPYEERRRFRWGQASLIFGLGVGFGCFAYGAYGYSQLFNGPILNQKGFTTYTLVSKEAISSTSSVFTLRPSVDTKANASIYAKAWSDGIWSVQVKQPQLQIARSYTPLLPVRSLEVGNSNDLRFLIRKDPHGEVSGYLHKLSIGAEIELRGPQLEYAVPRDIEEILFVAGGTGIAPALSITFTLLMLKSPWRAKSPKVRILWANRREEDALGLPMGIGERITKNLFSTSKPHDSTSDLSRVLSILQRDYKKELSLEYFVDEQGSFINSNVLRRYLSDNNKVDEERLGAKPVGRKLILVSGPEGFVNHYAGPKVWQGGVECQGPLGGVLRKLDLTNWEVWKL